MSATKAMLTLYLEAQTATEADVLAGAEGKLVTADVIAPLLGEAVPDAVVEAAVEQYFIDNPASGDVVGPASSVNDRIAVFSGTSGKIIKQGPVLGDGALLDVGTGANTLAAGDDTRWGFDSLAALSAAEIPETQEAVLIHGYYTPGDGGDGVYQRVETEPVHPGKVQTADGAWWELVESRPRAQQFGAVFTPSLGDAVPVEAALRAGIAYHQAKKTGYLSMPAGFGLLDGPGANWAIAAGSTSGFPALKDFHLQGAGKPSVQSGVLSDNGGTWLVIADDSDMGAITLSSPRNVVLSDFGIHGKLGEGGRAGCSNVRVTGMNEGITLRNLYSYRAPTYGVGLQGDIGDGSYHKHVRYENVTVEECGADGFDCKNRSELNDDLVANEITVINPNQLNVTGDEDDPIVGFDARGPWQVTNYVCRSNTPYTAGFRFRTGSDGGIRANLTNFSIDMGGATSTSGIAYEGIQVGIANGTIKDCTYRGVFNKSASYGCVISGVRAINCNVSFNSNTPSPSDPPNLFIGCESITPTTADTEFGTNIVAVGCNWLPYVGKQSTTNWVEYFGGTEFARVNTNGRFVSKLLAPLTDLLTNLGSAANRFNQVFARTFFPGAGTVQLTSGTGTPEGSVTAPVGSFYLRSDGAAGTVVYVKETGTGNTGWVAAGAQYEAGTFTPTVEFATPGTSSFTYSTQTCRFTRVGNRVFCEFNIVFTPTIGTGSGALRVSLPKTAANITAACGAVGLLNSFTGWSGAPSASLASTTRAQIGLLVAGSALGAIAASNCQNGVAHALSFRIDYTV